MSSTSSTSGIVKLNRHAIFLSLDERALKCKMRNIQERNPQIKYSSASKSSYYTYYSIGLLQNILSSGVRKFDEKKVVMHTLD